MLAKRTLVAVALLPVALAIILVGGTVYAAVVALILMLAGWEYVLLFRAGGLRPAGVLILASPVLFIISREVVGLESAPWVLSAYVLASMAYHLIAYERGRDKAATDFGVTLGGVLYVGWLGAYLVSLRSLPDGLWWVLITLPAVWLVDVGAYLFGHRFGRHKLSPRLSPKKTVEGYLGGVLAGVLGGALIGGLAMTVMGPGSAFTPLRGAILGLVLGLLTLFGDLGESMIKRQVGAKDSGSLLPGHGGMFDRIDSWLWAGVLSYYLISWFYY